MGDKDIYAYTPVQKANTILWLAESGSIEGAQDRFKHHYSNSKVPIPSKQLIYDWYSRFRDTGTTEESGHTNTMRDESTDMNFQPVPYLSMISSAEGDKTISSHQEHTEHRSSSHHHFSHTDPKTFHPFLMYLTKKLYIEDAHERAQFALQELYRLHHNPELLYSIWFTGEANFHTNGLVQVHNLRYATKNETVNPDEEGVASEDNVIVWAALNASDVLGPYFFLGDETSDSYQSMLREFFFDVRKHISVHEKPIFMHDDAPSHRKLNVQDFLDHEVPHHWIGTGSNYSNWPHHSPDISPLNYFLWGFIKSQVYKTPIESGDRSDLKNRISMAFKKVTPDMLKEAVEDFKIRLEKLLATKGALIGTSVNARFQPLPSTSINRSNNCFTDWQSDDDEITLDD